MECRCAVSPFILSSKGNGEFISSCNIDLNAVFHIPLCTDVSSTWITIHRLTRVDTKWLATVVAWWTELKVEQEPLLPDDTCAIFRTLVTCMCLSLRFSLCVFVEFARLRNQVLTWSWSLIRVLCLGLRFPVSSWRKCACLRVFPSGPVGCESLSLASDNDESLYCLAFV